MNIHRNIKKLWSGLNHIPQIRRQDYRPKEFQLNVHDIGRMYHLNQWFQKNTLKELWKYKS